VLRFRIAEEELERATIGGLTLSLELTGGRSLALLPDAAALRRADNRNAVELYANEEIEVSFSLPPHVEPGEVVRSRFTVTGYYDRYPALLLERVAPTATKVRETAEPSRSGGTGPAMPRH
jgi:hypothetical protein